MRVLANLNILKRFFHTDNGECYLVKFVLIHIKVIEIEKIEFQCFFNAKQTIEDCDAILCPSVRRISKTAIGYW